MKIVDLIQREMIVPSLVATDKRGILEELARHIASKVTKIDGTQLSKVLIDRESLASTAIGEGVAIPHGKVPGLPGLVATFGRSTQGIDFRAIDGRPTHLFFTLFAPENSAGAHLKALARISRIFKNATFREALMRAGPADELYRLIETEDAKY